MDFTAELITIEVNEQNEQVIIGTGITQDSSRHASISNVSFYEVIEEYSEQFGLPQMLPGNLIDQDLNEMAEAAKRAFKYFRRNSEIGVGDYTPNDCEAISETFKEFAQMLSAADSQGYYVLLG